jgi:multicomponent Na+:H+ antiporter subunit F
MSPAIILENAILFAQMALALALLLTGLRIVLGPTLADRVAGLDLLVAIGIGLIAILALKTDFALALDIAMALALAAFLATAAFARYILVRGRADTQSDPASASLPRRTKRRQERKQ